MLCCQGIGIMRRTANFAEAKIGQLTVTQPCSNCLCAFCADGAYQGSNREVVEMSFYLLRNEGLFVGPSSALNVVGAVKLARQMGPGHTIVTGSL